MSWDLSLYLMAALLTVTISLGIPIAAAMGLTGIVMITALKGTTLWPSLGDTIWNNVNSFTLTAVPLFVLMGEIILHSGAARRFYSGLAVLMKRLPGGLAQANIMACALFSAISGSSTATALTIGTVALPEMRKRGYSDSLTLGTLTGGGALGNLIPPSIFLLVYAAVVQQSVLDLFIATIIPGVIAVIFFMSFVAYKALRDPSLVPPKAPPSTPGEILTAIGQVLPMTVMIAAIIGSLYYGIATPTEAAAVSCLGALILALMYGETTVKILHRAIVNSMAVTCVISLIIINGQILGFAIVQADIGRGLSQLLVNSGLHSFGFFVLIFVLYLILGAMLDGISMMLLTVPILYPTLIAMGFSPIWFGVILVIQSELAQLSPPVGLNLFAVQSIAGNVSMRTITMASLPYVLMLSALTFLLYFVPGLALWLPATLK